MARKVGLKGDGENMFFDGSNSVDEQCIKHYEKSFRSLCLALESWTCSLEALGPAFESIKSYYSIEHINMLNVRR